MPMFGFPIKTKTNVGPRIKYFTCQLENSATALQISQWMAENCLANNAKADVNQRLVIHGENDIELDPDEPVINEGAATMLFTHNGDDGKVDGSAYLSVPCLIPQEMQSLCDYLLGKVQVLCTDNSYKTADSARIVRSTTYVV